MALSEREIAYQRRSFLLPGLSDAPDFHAPYYPPLPRSVFETRPAEYRSYVPWAWSGDLEAIRETMWTGERLEPDPASPERMFVDVGLVAQLKRCGFTTVYSGTCPYPRDEILAAFEQAIQENRRRMWNAVGALLDGVAAVASFIPVLGSAIAVVLSAAAAVATQRPIGSAIVGMVVTAVPGGAAVRDAVVPAAEFGRSILEGNAIEEAVIAAARAFAVEVGGDNAGTAFDLVLAAARGQNLQEAGFAIAARWFPGTDAGSRAARFGLRVANAAASGQSVERLLAREARAELESLGPVQSAQREVDAVVRQLLAEPRHFLGSFEAFAASLGVPREIARAAFMSVRPDGDGLRESRPFINLLVDPSAAIQGESAMLARAREWAAPKIDFASRAFVTASAGPLASETYRRALLPKFLVDEDEEEIPMPPPPSLERAPETGNRGSSAAIAGVFGVGALAALGIVIVTGRR